MGPAPLPSETLLEARYRLLRPLGQGGFGVTYLAEDLERGDRCVVKELAPDGAQRCEDGAVEWVHLGPATTQRLRRQFLQEAETLRAVTATGVLPVRDAFLANNTAYFVTSYIDGALSLDRLVAREGRLAEDQAVRLLRQALDTLAALHGRGLLHRDLKPSNVLVAPDGRLYLIDFGTARMWHADAAVDHTVQFTPGYAPIEQMSERARRGPATDLYGLSATLYWALTGAAPPAATDRAAGIALTPLTAVRPDVGETLCQAIEAGLALRYEDRPANAEAYHAALTPSGPPTGAAEVLAELDRRRLVMQRLRPGRRECPACGGVLAEARPLRDGQCPVCRQGKLGVRRLADRVCPACQAGILRPVVNGEPLRWCPACRSGRLVPQRALPWKPKRWVCAACAEAWTAIPGGARREAGEQDGSWAYWRESSGREARGWTCDSCEAQYDDMPDGRRRQVVPARGRWRELYPEEWARVAAGLDPGAGDIACSGCGAEFHAAEDTLTLLGAASDPYGFVARYQGRLLHRDYVAWLGAGKASGQPGLLCDGCDTELDPAGDEWRLAQTDHPVLRHHVDAVDTIEGWRRRALELPEAGHEQDLDLALADALREAYRCGQAAFDSRTPEVVWAGPAKRYEPQGDALSATGAGSLTISLQDLTFGGALRKTRFPLAEVLGFEDHDGLLWVQRSGGDLWFELEEIELHAKMDSGRVATTLSLDDLLMRLRGVR